MGGCCCCFSKAEELNSSPPFYHVELDKAIKQRFRKDMNILIQDILNEETIFICGDLFGQAERSSRGFEGAMRGFEFGDRKEPPSVPEVHEPLSAHHGAVSALSTGLLVDTNLEISIPETYRSPPAPLPYDANQRHLQTPSSNQESCCNKDDAAVHTVNAESAEEPNAGNTLETLDKDLKGSDCKAKMDTELASSNDLEIEIEKSGELKKSSEPIVSTLEEEEEICPTCFEEYDAQNPKIITKCEHHFHLSCILEWMERSDTCPVCDQEMVFDLAVGG